MVEKYRFDKDDDFWQKLKEEIRGERMREFFLGSDISKGYADFIIIDQENRVVEANFQLDDTFEGQGKLYEIVVDLLKKNPESVLYAAVESTGGYENNWYRMLKKCQSSLAVKVTRLNPLGVHHMMKADMKRNITDRLSARGIAEYLLTYKNKIEFEKEDYYSDLRKQMVFVKMLTKQKVQLENQLESLLYTSNPEVMVYCKDGMPQWVRLLLMKYPTSDKLSRAHVDVISRIPYISRTRAGELIDGAKTSVASSKGAIIETLITDTLTQITGIEQMIDKQLKTIKDNCPIEELDILTTFKGMGISSASFLLLEIGAIERFASAKKLASFFGLHPVFKQSGDGLSGVRMSKQGRRHPRAILYMVARAACLHNPVIKQTYQRSVSKGMKHQAAIGVCMHKILRIIYGMLKNKTVFNPVIDQLNQTKTRQTANACAVDTTRRYQKLDDLAPVSRRQDRKRKAQLLPQDVNMTS